MRYTGRMDELTRDHGPQPLDGLLERWNIANHELVEVSTEQLNHKQVQRARKGRQLTLHLMQKLMRKQLFNYSKGHDATWVDPNVELMPK